MVKTSIASKPWWQSVTIWAGISQIATGMGFTAFSIDWDTGIFHLEGSLYEIGQNIVPILTGAATIYGRVSATLGISTGSSK